MNKLIGAIALLCAFIPLSHAQESAGGKPQGTTTSGQSPSTVGGAVRRVGHDVKTAGRKVRRAVVTRCADGRHTVRGRAACASHGGVSARN